MLATVARPAAQDATGAVAWVHSEAFAELVLLRLSVSAATRAEIVRDLRPLVRPDLAPAAWRSAAEPVFADLLATGLLTETRGRLKATEPGLAAAANAAGVSVATETWASVRDGALVARALGLDPASKPALKALANADQLRALIVQDAFALGEGKPLPFAKLRSMLALRALERAFGNQIKSGLGSGTGLSAKPSRVLAGQLSKAPRDYGSDGRLIAALAAEHLGVKTAEPETLRLGLLRRAFADRIERQPASKHAPAPSPVLQARRSEPAPRSAVTTAPDRAPVANDRGAAEQRPLPAARPDLQGFVREVKAAAHRRADGWPGNRKAFISHVWDEISKAHAAWALSEIEFKAMLAEAHRLGGLVLANADLKDKRHLQDLEKSAIHYKNTVWHFVRVEEV